MQHLGDILARISPRAAIKHSSLFSPRQYFSISNNNNLMYTLMTNKRIYSNEFNEAFHACITRFEIPFFLRHGA